MQMTLEPPPVGLASSVRALWSLRGWAPGVHAGLPKPYLELVVNLGGPQAWYAERQATPITYRAGWLTPLQSGPRYARSDGEMHFVAARLELDAAIAIFGGDAVHAGATPISFDDLGDPSLHDLRERMGALPHDAARRMALADWIDHRLGDRSGIVPLPTDQLAAFDWRTDALAAHIGLSPRGLRKRFTQTFGIGPKAWLQLHRFDQLLMSGMAGGSLAGLAADFGFADQAHMTREFHRFAGVSPGLYLRRRGGDAPESAPHLVADSP